MAGPEEGLAAPAQEELEALAAIFCGPGEWEVLSRSGTQGAMCRVLTKAEGPSGADTPLELVFHLPAGYPACLPGVSVSSERLTRAQCAAVRDKLLEQAQGFLPEPMVHQLVVWVQQNLRHLLAAPGSGAGPGTCPAASATEAEGPWMTLLHLDHMRAKTRYVRTKIWDPERRTPADNFLLAPQEYLVLQKTSKVDVDSSGKKCRERMASVLWEARAPPGHARFLAFEVKELSSLDELRKEFETAGLEALFPECVLGLVK
ncbi:RWD domain-containing protein 3 isoform X3 [Myotis myotis]|uniref:RWD domain-containing protein 3 isoform X3 n=1 Tax=Myotis myotis TaxID=51298 RepID=UPI00174E87B5|nr:RWD domain-containing protein 3 isoform X3 [Myotis myotis]